MRTRSHSRSTCCRGCQDAPSVRMGPNAYSGAVTPRAASEACSGALACTDTHREV